MRLILLTLLILSTNCLGQQKEPSPDILYSNFVKAYDELNAEYLANLYTSNAEALNLYDNSNSNSLKGRQEIKEYYETFFQSIKNQKQKLVLTFKIVNRRKVNEIFLDNGFFRLEIASPNNPSIFSYGKFSTILELHNNYWQFKTDATTNTDFIEYENALSKTIPEREELLYAEFYDELLGSYVNSENQAIVIGRSQIKLYAFFESTNEYRGMNKVNATTWSIGKTVKSNEDFQTCKFINNRIEIYEGDKLVQIATKKDFYKTEKVEYKNPKGVKLAGTLFIPNKPNGKAIVLVHGSGPQDRNGYASIIRLLADIFTREGLTVLTYDKQGVGQSEGNSDIESFEDLAEDAIAGISFLKARNDLNLSKIGLGGSSQAGWIIAKALEKYNDKVDFALTIGAAGSGITVREQNIYNTEVSMQCNGSYSRTQIKTAIKQQQYFFDYLSSQKNAKKLDDFTISISKDTIIRDWLFPTSKQIDFTNRNQWFTVLEINYDPIPIWKNCTKPVLMVFSEFDDSTPALKVKSKVDKLNNINIQTSFLTNSQHIGLETNSVCKNDFSELTKFHTDFFTTMKNWLNAL